MTVGIVSLREGALVFLLGVFLVLVAKVARTVLPLYLTPIRHLREPPSQSRMWGNIHRMGGEHVDLNIQWTKEYGNNYVLRMMFQIPRLYTTDTRTINHVLTHSVDYVKPQESRTSLARIVGQGVLVAEGEQHRIQRRVMNPAFGPAQIRELTEIFLEKAIDLCTYWNAQIDTEGGSITRNATEGLSKMTLDVIGLAGFNYEFQSLNTELPPNELSQAFHEIFKQPPKFTLRTILSARLPNFKLLRDERARQIDEAQGVMRRIATQIFQEKKAEILREYSEKGSGSVEKKDMQGRDLLTLLIKANMATDIPDNQRMTDEEVLAQVPTFLVAGHETTSTATTWCLYALTQDLSVQQKLRAELLAVPTDMPTMEDLQALPYLDQVVRETLRLHSPVTITFRVADTDGVLPVSEPFVDRHGHVQNELRISKGTRIILPILALNRMPALWGDDATEFKPERWTNPPRAVASLPGVWGHMMTFLGGPHACIGYRFSLVEMKAILFTLIRNFEFELAVPKEEIKANGIFIQRPCLRSEVAKGSQLPLVIRPYKCT